MTFFSKITPEALAGPDSEPKYLRLARVLTAFAATPEARALGRFPPEPELAVRFGVSRRTVRAALEKLSEAHLICRIKRRGTVLASAVSPADWQSPRQRIGLVWPDSGRDSWKPLLDAVSSAAAERGYETGFYGYEMYDPESEERAFRRAVRESFGVIFYPSLVFPDERRIAELPETYPLALFDVPPEHYRVSSVSADHELGGYRLTWNLLAGGARRPGFVRAAGAVSSNDLRGRGFFAALAKAGVPASEELVFRVGETFNDDGFLDYLERTRVDSLLLASRTLPYYFSPERRKILEVLRRRKIVLAAFDLSRKEMARNPLFRYSAIQPRRELGEELFRLLEFRMKSPAAAFRKIQLAPEFLTAD